MSAQSVLNSDQRSVTHHVILCFFLLIFSFILFVCDDSSVFPQIIILQSIIFCLFKISFFICCASLTDQCLLVFLQFFSFITLQWWSRRELLCSSLSWYDSELMSCLLNIYTDSLNMSIDSLDSLFSTVVD